MAKTRYSGKTVITFPNDVMTVTIPKTRDGEEIILEVKEIEDDVKENFKADNQGRKIKQVLTSIGFFVYVNDEKTYLHDLDPPAEIKILYNTKMENATRIEFVYWDKSKSPHEWTAFPDQTPGQSFATIKTPGWENDPSIGWR